MKQKVKEVVFSQLFGHPVLVRFEKIASHGNLKGIAVIEIDQKEANSYSSEQTSYIGQNLVYFLEGTVYSPRYRRFEDHHSRVKSLWICRVYLVSIFDTILSDNAASLDPCLGEGNDTLISSNSEIFHPKLTFSSSSL